MTSPHELQESPLYRELGRIGRSERSIRPTALESYPRLLRCTAVTQRAGPTASTRQRAKHAHDVLTDAINALVDRVDHRVAVAVLCAASEFEGTQVKARKEVLATEGISEDSYKERRPRVLQFIIRFLEPTAVSSDTQAIDSTVSLLFDIRTVFSPKRLTAANYLDRLTFPAIRLHYVSLAALFSAALEEEKAERGVVDLPPDQPDTCAECVFDAFANYLYGIGPPLLHRQGRHIAPLVPDSDRLLLLHLARAGRDCGPPLTPNDHELLRHHGYRVDHGWHYSRTDKAHPGNVASCYWRVWMPWYLANDPRQVHSLPSSIEELAANAGAISMIIRRYRITDDAYDHARRQAHLTLSYYYRHRSVRYTKQELHAAFDNYVSDRGPALAEQACVCQNK